MRHDRPGHTRVRRFAAGEIPPPRGPRLLAALAREHARAPFSPGDPRECAHRVVRVASTLDLEAVLVRGSLDVGGAALDHVWAVVADRVVDVPMPLRSAPFLDLLRAYIAGDLDDPDLDRAAHPYAIDWRVVGRFPASVRYYGQPFWSGASPTPGAVPS